MDSLAGLDEISEKDLLFYIYVYFSLMVSICRKVASLVQFMLGSTRHDLVALAVNFGRLDGAKRYLTLGLKKLEKHNFLFVLLWFDLGHLLENF